MHQCMCLLPSQYPSPLFTKWRYALHRTLVLAVRRLTLGNPLSGQTTIKRIEVHVSSFIICEGFYFLVFKKIRIRTGLYIFNICNLHLYLNVSLITWGCKESMLSKKSKFEGSSMQVHFPIVIINLYLLQGTVYFFLKMRS